MSLKRKNADLVLALITVISLPVIALGQPEAEDTVKLLSEDLKRIMADSTAEPANTDTTVAYEEEYLEEEDTTSQYLFVRKDAQPNGGGPESPQWRKLPDSLLNKWKKDESFWYVNAVFEKKEVRDRQPGRPFTQTAVFQTLLWVVIIGGFAAFVIIYLANSNVRLFRRKDKVILSDEEMEAGTDNIFEINYQKEIDKAVGNGNYRLAVRLMFLRALRTLSEKNIIQYKPDRTNLDYLVQLQPTRHYVDFFRLTRNYEFSWWGLFDIDKEKFYLIRNDFENFHKKLK
jgi:hypothetical protein